MISMLKPLFDFFETEIQKQSVFEAFKFAKTRRAFQRRIGSEVQSIHFCYIKYSGYFDITCDVAVRFDEVEDLLIRERSYLADREKKQTFTIGAQLENIRKNRQTRWTIATFEDVQRSVVEIADEVAVIGIPFLEQYSDPAAAALSLADSETARTICPINAGPTLSAFRELGYG